MSFSYARTSIKTEKGESELLFTNDSGTTYSVPYAYTVNNGIVTITFQDFESDVGSTTTGIRTVTGLPNSLLPYSAFTEQVVIVEDSNTYIGYVSFYASGTLVLGWGSGSAFNENNFQAVCGFLSFTVSYFAKGANPQEFTLDFAGATAPLKIKYVQNGSNIIINTDYELSYSYNFTSNVQELVSINTVPAELTPINNCTFPVLSQYTPGIPGTGAPAILYFTIFGVNSGVTAGKCKFNSDTGAQFGNGDTAILLYRSLNCNYYVNTPMYEQLTYKWTSASTDQTYDGWERSSVANVQLSIFNGTVPISTATATFTSLASNPLRPAFDSYGSGSCTYVPLGNPPGATYNTGVCRINSDGTVTLSNVDGTTLTAGPINLTCTTVGSGDLLMVQSYINNLI